MPTHRIGLPDDKRDRELHLRGLNEALAGKPSDAPALSPDREVYLQGWNVGNDMAQRNHARRKALQDSQSGLEHRIKGVEEAKKARKLPPLP